jgi:hypothetical protein
MVSEALKALSGHFGHWAARGGVQMDDRVCQLMADQLKDIAETATALEGQPVPAAMRATPPGVVNLSLEREARLLRRQGGDWGAM